MTESEEAPETVFVSQGDLAARLEALWGTEKPPAPGAAGRESGMAAPAETPKREAAAVSVPETAPQAQAQEAESAGATEPEKAESLDEPEAMVSEAPAAAFIPMAQAEAADAPAQEPSFREAAQETESAGALETVETESPAAPQATEDAGEQKAAPEAISGPLPEAPQKEKKKGRVTLVLLVIVIIALAIEIVILGVKLFLPDSGAAALIDDVQAKVTELFRGNGDEGSGEEEEEPPVEETGSDELEPAEEPETIDHEPAADPAALVASQAHVNENIQTLRANQELKYVSGRDYGQEDVNDSVSIEDNYWTTTEDGEILYYDQQAAAAVIAFDSAWNEYVNGGSEEVLSWTKEGSAAYRNADQYSKVGRVTQEFKLLEIGEIRRGENGFYVWTYEEISETENGRTTEKQYYWIYLVEPVGEEMKIVNYYSY
ncbi:MAG: hypothetical protein Q4C22_02385 [Bacillota bacterium]|nr:hypothetical protein [Bacillota bacterium]